MPPDPQFEPILAMMRDRPPLADLPLAMIRGAPPPNPSPTKVDEVSDRMIPGPGGELKVRIYRASASRDLPLLVFFHGGGFVVGNIDTHDEMARAITAQTGCVTVSVDYRLAPEHPFPAASDDCFAALKWSVAHARDLGADPARVAIVGDSAGGNLAALVAQQARDEDGPALRGQVLVYPVTDFTAPQFAAPDGEHYILTPKDKDFFNRSYLPDPSMLKPASPGLAESVRGVASALVITGEYDPLCAQGEAYAARLKEAGVDAKSTRYDGAVHGFASFPVPMGAQALREISDWLKPRLA